jgi:hypothetical protein
MFLKADQQVGSQLVVDIGCINVRLVEILGAHL